MSGASSSSLTTELEKLSLLAASIDVPDDPVLASLLLEAQSRIPTHFANVTTIIPEVSESFVKIGDSRICYCGAVQNPSKFCVILRENWNILEDFMAKMQ
jgi:hypothetical protein